MAANVGLIGMVAGQNVVGYANRRFDLEKMCSHNGGAGRSALIGLAQDCKKCAGEKGADAKGQRRMNRTC